MFKPYPAFLSLFVLCSQQSVLAVFFQNIYSYASEAISKASLHTQAMLYHYPASHDATGSNFFQISLVTFLGLLFLEGTHVTALFMDLSIAFLLNMSEERKHNILTCLFLQVKENKKIRGTD